MPPSNCLARLSPTKRDQGVTSALQTALSFESAASSRNVITTSTPLLEI